jgi:hypothetical protein
MAGEATEKYSGLGQKKGYKVPFWQIESSILLILYENK